MVETHAKLRDDKDTPCSWIQAILTFTWGWFLLPALIFGSLFFCTCQSQPANQEQQSVFVPPISQHQSWWVPETGQLSGLTYDPSRHTLWAVGDQSACLSDEQTMKLYTQIPHTEVQRCGFIYRIPLPGKHLENATFKRYYLSFPLSTMNQLINKCHLPIGSDTENMIQFNALGDLLKYRVDLEGIAIYPDNKHLLIYAEDGWNTFFKVAINDRSLTVLDCYSDFLPDSDRDNKGIEGLTISPDGWVYFVHESRLELYRIHISMLKNERLRKEKLEIYPIGDDFGLIESFCGITIVGDQLYLLDRNLSNLIRIPIEFLKPNHPVPLYYKPLVTHEAGLHFQNPKKQYFEVPSLEGITYTPDGMFWFCVDPWYSMPGKYLPLSSEPPYKPITIHQTLRGVHGGAEYANYFKNFTPMLIQARLRE